VLISRGPRALVLTSTYIERNNISSWERGEGIFVYNDTGNNYTDNIPIGTYYYRAWSYTEWGDLNQWSDDSALAKAVVFESSVITNNATNILSRTATLHGYLDDDGGEPCKVWFEYGETESYGDITSYQYKSSNESFSVNISGLKHLTNYHYRAVAENSNGTQYGNDVAFQTLLAPPINLSVDASATRLDISWDKNEGVRGDMIFNDSFEEFPQPEEEYIFPKGWSGDDWVINQSNPYSTWFMYASGQTFSASTYPRVNEANKDGIAQDENLTSPTINCSGLTNVWLQFTKRHDRPSGSDATTYVYGSADNGTTFPHLLATFTTTSTAAEYIDISAWADNCPTVKIMYRFTSGTEAFNGYFYFDRMFVGVPTGWGPLGDNPPLGWTITPTPPSWTNNHWHQPPSFYTSYDCSWYPARIYYVQPYETVNSSLTSPSINCSGLSDVFLRFNGYFYFYSSSPGYGYVEISTDNGSNWDTVLSLSASTQFYEHPERNLFNITSWASGEPDVRIRFRYEHTDAEAGRYWYVDNVRISDGSDWDYVFYETFDGPTAYHTEFKSINLRDWGNWTQEKVTGTHTNNIFTNLESGTNPTCYPYDGSRFIRYNSYNIVNRGEQARLYNFVENFSGDLQFRFMMYHDNQTYQSNIDRIEIQVTEDMNNWTTISEPFYRSCTLQGLGSQGWYEHTVNIIGYENPIYIGFLATNDYGNNIFFDNLKIYELTPVSIQIQMNTTSSPTTPYEGTTIYNGTGDDYNISVDPDTYYYLSAWSWMEGSIIWSEEYSIWDGYTPPLPPENVSAVETTPANITISWTKFKDDYRTVIEKTGTGIIYNDTGLEYIDSVEQGETYYYNLKSYNETTMMYSEIVEVNITTLDYPVVVTKQPTNITLDSAILQGELSSTGGTDNCSVWFEYGSTLNYSNSTSIQIISSGNLSYNLTNLSHGRYHYRAVADNGLYIAYGDDISFIMNNTAPVAFNGTPDNETVSVYTDLSVEIFDIDNDLMDVTFYLGADLGELGDIVVWDNGDIDETSIGGGSLSDVSQLDTTYPFNAQKADDFILDNDTYITNVHWWGLFYGGYEGGSYPNPAEFNIIFYADNGSEPTGAGMSDPTSTALIVYNFPSINGILVGEDIHGNPIYYYNAELPTPFFAEKDIKYWMVVQWVGNYTTTGLWVWVTNGNNPERLNTSVHGFLEIGAPYWTINENGDLAFYLEGLGNVLTWSNITLYNQTNGVIDVYASDIMLMNDSTNYTWYVEITDEYGATSTSEIWNFNTTDDDVPWDIIQDGKINALDVSALVSRYGASGPPGWIRQDINKDGNVNALDVSILISHYGEEYV
jgi:hypothetical protein